MQVEDSSKPWPYWMLRAMMSNDAQGFSNLVWSVGGSPPYGGISYEEAAAVYDLIEDFRGSGTASGARYDAVRSFLRKHPERERVLDLFYCYDEIVSASENYSPDVARRGLAIARSMDEPGAIGLFKLFQSQVLTRQANTAEAAKLTLEALGDLLTAAEKDPACSHRVTQAAQNAVTLTAVAGDKPRAAELLDSLSEVLPAQILGQLRRWLSQQS